MSYQQPPNQHELTTEPITYDMFNDQHHDQEQEQDNNQAVGSQNDETMHIVDNPASNEDGEGQNNTDDQTEQSNNDKKESAHDDAEESAPQPNKTTTTSSGHAVQ